MTELENYNEPKSEFVNIATLFQKREYKDTLTSMREMVKPVDTVDRPLVITGYMEDKMTDARTKEEKDCFRMDFYFADDESKTPHYIRTEAKYLWEYLKTVNAVDPDLLKSGTVVAVICKGEKKVNGFNTPFYFFAGTME